MNNFTIKNAWICQIVNGSIAPVFGEIEVEDGKIACIKPKNVANNSNETQNDAGCRIVTVPLINFHHHFYSQLVKGLPFNGDLHNFEHILKNLWWKLDQQLDLDTITACAQLAGLESIRQGVTYIFDHHSSPAAISGSLSTIKGVVEKLKLRAVLCYETSDRNGKSTALDSLRENEQFTRLHSTADVKSMLGLHASFTLSDDTLQKASEILQNQNLGIHIHLCEDEIDRQISTKKYHRSPVERLKDFDLLNSKGILTHGVHLTDSDYSDITKFGSAIAYNPDSNLNNAVGLPRFLKVPPDIPILIGTDGMHSNIARSMKQLFLLYRYLGGNAEETFNWIKRIYFDQLDFIKKYFTDFPSLQAGDRADFIVWDYVPPNFLTPDNFWGHFICGALESPIYSVMHAGTYLMEQFRIQHVNKSAIRKNVCKQGQKLYQRIKNLRNKPN